MSKDPGHVGARIEAGNIAFEEGRLDEAITHYEKALEKDPDCVEAIYNAANIYFKQKKYAVAIRWFHRCIELDSEFPESYYNLAQARMTPRRIFFPASASLNSNVPPAFCASWERRTLRTS
ncbi:MAG: tetratricopeptide repeat protein [Spirochaetia bacterium]|nr:tetratricopeptide repeat protein [Spirochaetia bacterium]